MTHLLYCLVESVFSVSVAVWTGSNWLSGTSRADAGVGFQRVRRLGRAGAEGSLATSTSVMQLLNRLRNLS